MELFMPKGCSDLDEFYSASFRKKRYESIEAHFVGNLTLQKESSKVKIPESIRGEKEVVEKNSTFVYDSVKK